MTPQEKAQQLYDRFCIHAAGSWPMQGENAKKAACIHIDEVLNLLSQMESDDYLFKVDWSESLEPAWVVFEYFEKVKECVNLIER